MAGRAACRRRRQPATRQASEHQRRLPRGVKGRWQTGHGIVTRSLRNGVFSFRSGVIWHGLSLLGDHSFMSGGAGGRRKGPYPSRPGVAFRVGGRSSPR